MIIVGIYRRQRHERMHPSNIGSTRDQVFLSPTSGKAGRIALDSFTTKKWNSKSSRQNIQFLCLKSARLRDTSHTTEDRPYVLPLRIRCRPTVLLTKCRCVFPREKDVRVTDDWQVFKVLDRLRSTATGFDRFCSVVPQTGCSCICQATGQIVQLITVHLNGAVPVETGKDPTSFQSCCSNPAV
jgi:hypothetical protein